CRFECGVSLSIRNGDAATHLYRIIQEALHNAVKHSQAQCIVVSLTQQGSHILASIIDDGVGFTPGQDSRVEETESPGGLGMHTMQYRAHIIGATLDFNQTPGGGTTVVCQISKRKLGC